MPKTEWIGCAEQNFRCGRLRDLKPEAIVIHVSEGTLASADAWFQNPKAGVSAHYCVGRNGDVHQYVEEEDTAFHAGLVTEPTWKLIRRGVNPNFYTIGIEHEGTAEQEWTGEQYAASAQLVNQIAERWGISLDADHIVMHREIRATKTCPGERFDRNRLLELATCPPESASRLPAS